MYRVLEESLMRCGAEGSHHAKMWMIDAGILPPLQKSESDDKEFVPNQTIVIPTCFKKLNDGEYEEVIAEYLMAHGIDVVDGFSFSTRKESIFNDVKKVLAGVSICSAHQLSFFFIFFFLVLFHNRSPKHFFFFGFFLHRISHLPLFNFVPLLCFYSYALYTGIYLLINVLKILQLSHPLTKEQDFDLLVFGIALLSVYLRENWIGPQLATSLADCEDAESLSVNGETISEQARRVDCLRAAKEVLCNSIFLNSFLYSFLFSIAPSLYHFLPFITNFFLSLSFSLAPSSLQSASLWATRCYRAHRRTLCGPSMELFIKEEEELKRTMANFEYDGKEIEVNIIYHIYFMCYCKTLTNFFL